MCNYYGKLPWPVIDAGFTEWSIVNLPLKSTKEHPTLWKQGVPVTKEELVAQVVRIFIEKITNSYFSTMELELAFRKGSKLSMILVKDEEGFKFSESIDDTPMGQRIEKALGITLLEGDKDVKRHSQFREYDARGSMSMEELNLIYLDEIVFPKSETTLFDFACVRSDREFVILQIKQIMWELGYRDAPGYDQEELKEKFKKCTDGAGLISPSFRARSVAWMQMHQDEFGIHWTMIKKCRDAKQMSFRAALPGSGQIKLMAQVAEWLPDDFLLLHSQNVKKEWRVAVEVDGVPVPFRYWWDAFSGKDVSRTNMQFVVAHRFLFPDNLIYRSLGKMKERHLALLEEKGFVDDHDELLDSILSDDENALQNSFSAFARYAPMELSQHGLNPLEFPVVVTRAATASIAKWCNLSDASLRIEIPASVHWQIVSELILLLADPDAPRVESKVGIRFHQGLKVAYVMDERYLQVIKDHGGADMDDFWDLRVVRWSKTRVVVIRLRAPTRPGEWGIDDLEGPMPDALISDCIETIWGPIKFYDVETLSEEEKAAIVKELPRRAHLHPAIENPVVEMQEGRIERELYSWGRVKDQVAMSSMNPGMGVNWMTTMWFIEPHIPLPCGMDFLVDTFIQEGLKYGEQGLMEIQEILKSWFETKFFKHLDVHKKDLSKCLFDSGFLFRKGIVKGLKLADRMKKIRYQRRPQDWYSNLLEGVHAEVEAFARYLREWIVEKSNALEEHKFLAGVEDVIQVTAKERTFTDVYSHYNACYLKTDGRNCTLSYLVAAMEAEGLTYFNMNEITKDNWKGKDITKVLDRKLVLRDENGRIMKDKETGETLTKDFPWQWDVTREHNPMWNFTWGHAVVNDGKYTKDGYTTEAAKVKRTGGVLISREFLTTPEEIVAATKHCLLSYQMPQGRRLEEFLLEEENFDNFLTWLVCEFEVGGKTNVIEQAAPILPPPAPAAENKRYVFTFSKVNPDTGEWTSGSEWISTSSRKVLLTKCNDALTRIGDSKDRFVSVTTQDGTVMKLSEMIEKLAL